MWHFVQANAGSARRRSTSPRASSRRSVRGAERSPPAYARGLDQVAAGARLARARGLAYVVRAVTNVHGETDHVLKNADYAKDLAEWQADYERDVRAVTGQAEPIPMLHTQVSSWTKFGQASSGIPQAQLAASVASGGKLVLVGPKYHLAYAKDGSVFSNRERLLPPRPRGHYREYTVPTPGSRDRGARRIVTGGGVDAYWTPDHYSTFFRIVERQP